MKTCSVENCINPVWGKHLCKSHQYLRTDKKPKKPSFRTQKERVHEITFGFEDQLSMFQALWENAKDKNGIVICPYTGKCLNRFCNAEQWFSCFSHVLPKGRYPYFKLNPDNVCIVHPYFHMIIDQGTTKDREKYPEWKWSAWDSKVFEMKEKYAQFKKDNLLA